MPKPTQNIVLQNNDRTVAALSELFGEKVTARIGADTLEAVYTKNGGWTKIAEINQAKAAEIARLTNFAPPRIVAG